MRIVSFGSAVALLVTFGRRPAKELRNVIAGDFARNSLMHGVGYVLARITALVGAALLYIYQPACIYKYSTASFCKRSNELVILLSDKVILSSFFINCVELFCPNLTFVDVAVLQYLFMFPWSLK